MLHGVTAPRRLRPRCFAHLRAACIVLCLLTMAVMLLPDGSRMGKRQVWKSPLNQSQFALWSATLRRAGIEVSAKEFEQRLWEGVQRYLSIRDPLASLVEPVNTQLAVAQGWRMFSNPQTHPARVHIELDRGDGFETLYVSRSESYTWRRQQFDHNRIRKLVGRIARKGRDQTYAMFVNWVAREVKREFGEARRVRVRLYRWETPEPGFEAARYDASGQFEELRYRRLRDPRP